MRNPIDFVHFLPDLILNGLAKRTLRDPPSFRERPAGRFYFLKHERRPAPNPLDAHPVEARPPHPLGLHRGRLDAVLRRHHPVGAEQLLILVALVFLFFVVTGVFIYLLFISRRETKKLERQAIEVRAAMVAEKLDEQKKGKP
jgi:hypothetical protein